MNDFKLQVEKHEQEIEIDNNGNNVLIYSEYDVIDEHSISLRDYLNEQKLKATIIPSEVKKGITSSYCDILVEKVLFFIVENISSNFTSWAISKFLDWLWDEERKIIKEKQHIFKKRNFFIVRCPISIYDKKNKKVKTTVYTGEIKEVISKIKSDFNIK